ncbi:MAG: hypothetical protein JRH06_07110 [Deltaproteobacteria bacterium]|nr:hypothetical protein [Deltaproteobacteria bacterium]MBW2137311.1 hypothetical protein [Deltaproteobacteria bacterium]
MALSPSELANAVFKPTLKGDVGELSLDGMTLKVLLVLDGTKNLGTIAEELGLKLGEIRILIKNLLELGIIERVETRDSFVEEDFVGYLEAEFSLAVGPIAVVLIEDVLYELGIEPGKVPKHRVAEIVESLSRQIPRNENKIAFEQAMMSKIDEKGY